MIVNTQRLFTQLLGSMRISAVFDVGSMNGADALRMKVAAPRSAVYAFEPNPDNFRLMQSNTHLQAHNIRVLPMAVSDCDGEAELFLVGADYERADPRRGMSSLYRRSSEMESQNVVRVPTTRLDTFLRRECASDARVALWVDAEGKAYEVIEGLGRLAGQVHLLHVEVETSACIGDDQRLYPEVKAQLLRLGLTEVATDHPHQAIQFNAVFVRFDSSNVARVRIRVSLIRARLRYLLVRLARRVCPGCVQRYVLMRRTHA